MQAFVSEYVRDVLEDAVITSKVTRQAPAVLQELKLYWI